MIENPTVSTDFRWQDDRRMLAFVTENTDDKQRRYRSPNNTKHHRPEADFQFAVLQRLSRADQRDQAEQNRTAEHELPQVERENSQRYVALPHLLVPQS